MKIIIMMMMMMKVLSKKCQTKIMFLFEDGRKSISSHVRTYIHTLRVQAYSFYDKKISKFFF